MAKEEETRIMDFESFGRERGLSGRKLARFAQYLTIRDMAKSTGVFRDPGYVGHNWIRRFKEGQEFAESDPFGRLLLLEMDKEHYSKKENQGAVEWIG